MTVRTEAMDGNSAAAWVGYVCKEIIGIYLITRSSSFKELWTRILGTLRRTSGYRP